MVTFNDIIEVLGLNTTFSDDVRQAEVTGLAPLDSAPRGSLSFLSSGKFRRMLSASQASFILINEKDLEHVPESAVGLCVDDPYLAYARVSQLFDLTPKLIAGVHPSAIVDTTAEVAESAAIGPNVVVGAHAVIGERVQVKANSVIEDYAEIGRQTRIGMNVTIAHRCRIGNQCLIQSGTVIGTNGFGYAPTEIQWIPISQLGTVVVGDGVEIGANCTIDRGAIEDTRIEDNVIIDNLVHIAHNVKIGKKTAIAGQVGIAGGAVIGENCSFGGQAGVAGHIEIADNSHFTGQAMITKGTKEGGLFSSGLPAQSSRDWRKMVARIRQLETINERLSKLEKRVDDEDVK